MLPQLPPVKKYKSLTPIGVLILLFYTFQNFIPGIEKLSRPAAYIIVLGVFCLTMVTFFPELKRDAPVFFRNFPTYAKFFFPKFGTFLLIYFVTAITISVIVGEASANQTALQSFPIGILAVMAIVYAPLQEETIYRGFLRRIIPNDACFILVSALVFAMIHMLQPGQTLLQYLYVLEYALLGGFLAWLYVKSDNIFVAMLGHCCLNLIAFLPMLL